MITLGVGDSDDVSEMRDNVAQVQPKLITAIMEHARFKEESNKLL